MPLTPQPEARAYFVRLAVQPQHPGLGYMQAGQFYPNDYGSIVADAWVRAATNRKGLDLDQWTITPYELCGIVFIHMSSLGITQVERDASALTQKPWILSSFITSFKAAAAKRINLQCSQLGSPIWQPNYYGQYLEDAATLAQVRANFLGAQPQQQV